MTIPITALQDYVATRQADKEFLQTGRKESAAFNKFLAKKKTRGGSLQQLNLRNGSQATNAKWVLPGDASDYVGLTPGSNVFQTVEASVPMQFSWNYATTNLAYSGILLQQAKTAGEAQLADYLDTRLQFSNGEIVEMIGDGIIRGRGNGQQSTLASVTGSTGTEPYGLIYQNRVFSGTVAGNANSPATNTHLGQLRHLQAELVSNELDATAGYGSDYTETVTLTNGSTAISGLTSGDYFPYRLWEIWWDESGSGTYKRLGREYVVADTAATGGAATTVQMSQVFRGTTGSYSVKLKAPYNTTTHGAAGLPNTAKLNKAYYLASDGKNFPDMGLVEMMGFASIQTLIQAEKRVLIVKNMDFESKGYDNFMYNQATMVVDNNINQGEVHFINTAFSNLYCLQGMEDYRIGGSDIIEGPFQQGFKSYVAQKAFPFQLVCSSPRNNAVIRNLEV
jgi:hypothetical protein